MKKLIIVVLILLFATWYYGWPKKTDNPRDRTRITQAMHELPHALPLTRIWNPRPSPDSLQPSPDLIQSIQKIAALARFELPTQKAREDLITLLSKEELQLGIWNILQQTDERYYAATDERLRMNAISVLGLILRYKDVSHRDEMIQWMRYRILSIDFELMKDIQNKQSIYGDLVEMLLIMKQYEAKSFQELASRIMESKKKVLLHALAASS